jgi:hypothetical protein
MAADAWPGARISELCEAEFIGKIRLLGVKLPTSVLASAAFVKI